MPLMRSMSASASSGTMSSTRRAVASPALSRSRVEEEICAFAPSITPFTSAKVFSTSVEKSASCARRFKRNAAGTFISFSASVIVTVANCDLRIHVFEFALHFLDRGADASQFLLHFEQVGDLVAFRFQDVDQPRLHHARILQARVGIEILLRHVVRPERLVLQFAEPAEFQEKRVERFRKNFDDNLAAQFSVCLFRGIAGRNVAAHFGHKAP